jgi:hypothetical protein
LLFFVVWEWHDYLFINILFGSKYQLNYLFLHHQVVVEKKLMREKNLSRHDVGREKFLCEVGALFLTLTNSTSV